MRRDSRAKPDHYVTEVETLDGRRVPVVVRVNARARRVSVRIDPMRRIAVATAPNKSNLKRAHQFAAERANWIASELERLPAPIALEAGGCLPLRGLAHALVFERGRGGARVEPGEPPSLIAPAPDETLFQARVLRFLKSEATADLNARVAAHAATLGVAPKRIVVKDMRSRWGSCSAEGDLAFSWRVILAPPFVLDYLAAHEVAHLREMNHSRRFWAQVRACLPDYETGRAWLNQHGVRLHAVG